MALMLILIAAPSATYQPEWTNFVAAWTTATFIWFYTAFFGMLWGPVSWTVISEVFPLPQGPTEFFLVFMLVGIAFRMWVLPETFGKLLEKMDLAFIGEGQADVARVERIF
ncbi:hypothetical protein C8R44DRAFT_762030, partial [Mycena epipterygia]